MMRFFAHSGLAGILLTARLASAIDLDINSQQSIVTAARTIVEHIFTIYKGNETGQTPGLLPSPYYWWEAGLMFDSLINYWAISGDQDLTEVLVQGLAFQIGPDDNFMPLNQSKSLGNDDQSFWASAALTAAEYGLPQLSSLNITWDQLAENAFQDQVLRWGLGQCNGGLKWQIFTFNNGYNYKNTVSTLSFAVMSARLARFTGNTTYVDWAEKSVQWLEDVGLFVMKPKNSAVPSRIAIYDGTDDMAGCNNINHLEWSQNAGLLLTASAYASNATDNADLWQNSTDAGIAYTNNLFTKTPSGYGNDGVLTEPACMPSNNCNVDQIAFRTSLARGLARSRDLMPDFDPTFGSESSSHAAINRILQASALAAAKACTGGESGSVCGFDWAADKYDGREGIGEDLAALEVILANLPGKKFLSMNVRSGGNGTGNGTAVGSGSDAVEAGSSNGTAPEAVGSQNAASVAGTSTFALGAVMLGAAAVLL